MHYNKGEVNFNENVNYTTFWIITTNCQLRKKKISRKQLVYLPKLLLEKELVFFATFGEMKSISINAQFAAEPFPSMQSWSPEIEADKCRSGLDSYSFL